MKLSKYVEHLQGVLKSEGDMDIVYSTDDDGNNFHEVGYAGCTMYFESPEDYYLEQIDESELEDYPDHKRAYCIN